MRAAVAIKPMKPVAEPQLVSVNASVHEINAFPGTIARRAFEIFQSRGRTDGSDQEDWFRAEAELFHAAHLYLYDSEDALAVSAEVPGFAPEELSISVEPWRLTITGKRATNHRSRHRVLYCDACADRIFRALGLPVEVDPNKATGALRNGVLELALPKSGSARTANSRSYTIVLDADSRRWTEPVVRVFRDRA